MLVAAKGAATPVATGDRRPLVRIIAEADEGLVELTVDMALLKLLHRAATVTVGQRVDGDHARLAAAEIVSAIKIMMSHG